MASLARSSEALACGVPARSNVRRSTLVPMRASSKRASGRVSRSSKPVAGSCHAEDLGTEGATTSASTSNTLQSISMARLIARLRATKVLPSPGTALVTMMRLRLGACAAVLPSACWIERPLDDAELVQQLRMLERRRNESGSLQPGEVEVACRGRTGSDGRFFGFGRRRRGWAPGAPWRHRRDHRE